jgi:hypothetical protein
VVHGVVSAPLQSFRYLCLRARKLSLTSAVCLSCASSDAMSPADLVALGAQLNGELIYFAQTCDPRLQPPVIPPAPPPAPNGVVGGESGRQCTDGQDNDGDGIMDCDDPDCDGEFMCSVSTQARCSCLWFLDRV